MNSWNEYKKLLEERPELFVQSDQIRIVFDEAVVNEFCKKTGKSIGVVYQSEFNTLVVDLIQADDGSFYAYERIVPTAPEGAVVALTVHKGNFVLLNQFRHALRGCQYSFPRGFGETGVSTEDNVRKELKEELGADTNSIKYIGTVIADSGLSGNEVPVFACNVSNIQTKQNYEGIKDCIEVTRQEFEKMIADGKITDGFTLSAYCLYKATVLAEK